LSRRTVEVYRANVMTKMHADSLPELVKKALSVKSPDHSGGRSTLPGGPPV
jgi:hypothetical protein